MFRLYGTVDTALTQYSNSGHRNLEMKHERKSVSIYIYICRSIVRSISPIIACHCVGPVPSGPKELWAAYRCLL